MKEMYFLAVMNLGLAAVLGVPFGVLNAAIGIVCVYVIYKEGRP